MIIYRDDDIYLTSSKRSGQIYDFEAFKVVHEMLSKNGKIHTLAIIASEIDNHPELTEYILERKNEFEFGVHGWEHSDYSTWKMEDVERDLQMAKEKIEKTFDTKCVWFFAPWNRWNEELILMAKEVGLTLNTEYLTPDQDPRSGVLCFHYWIPEQREQLKKWLK